jgi:hypothetical protein
MYGMKTENRIGPSVTNHRVKNILYGWREQGVLEGLL